MSSDKKMDQWTTKAIIIVCVIMSAVAVIFAVIIMTERLNLTQNSPIVAPLEGYFGLSPDKTNSNYLDDYASTQRFISSNNVRDLAEHCSINVDNKIVYCPEDPFLNGVPEQAVRTNLETYFSVFNDKSYIIISKTNATQGTAYIFRFFDERMYTSPTIQDVVAPFSSLTFKSYQTQSDITQRVTTYKLILLDDKPESSFHYDPNSKLSHYSVQSEFMSQIGFENMFWQDPSIVDKVHVKIPGDNIREITWNSDNSSIGLKVVNYFTERGFHTISMVQADSNNPATVVMEADK